MRMYKVWLIGCDIPFTVFAPDRNTAKSVAVNSYVDAVGRDAPRVEHVERVR